MKKIILILFCIALIGCASITPEILEQSQGNKISSVVSSSPDVVYERIVSKVRNCMAQRGFSVDADFFQKTGSARISSVLHGRNGRHLTAATTVLSPQGTSKTLAVTHYAQPAINPDGWKWLAQSTDAWANGKLGECKVHAL